jgi:hypothetical protein
MSILLIHRSQMIKNACDFLDISVNESAFLLTQRQFLDTRVIFRDQGTNFREIKATQFSSLSFRTTNYVDIDDERL